MSAAKRAKTGPEPIKVCITGAAGQIAYSLINATCAGKMFGPDQPIDLLLLEVPVAACMEKLQGVAMEIEDCAFEVVSSVTVTSEPLVAFKGCNVALLVGAMPRKDGMLRKDLLAKNAGIFKSQGEALNQVADSNCKILVVGNPANTNAMIASHFCPRIPKKNFTALTKLDHYRAQHQIAAKAGSSVGDVKNLIIWGNHSKTQFPDASFGTVDGKPILGTAGIDAEWLKGDFVPTVQTRGAAVIKARGFSSAMSAANAIVGHVNAWWVGTPEGEWTSMGVISDGSKYGIPEGICYSFPCKCKGAEWEIVDGLEISDFSRGMMDKTKDELVEEKAEALSGFE